MSDQGATVFGDRFELHRRLARGGMADVFLARDQLLDRPVAVKVLFAEFARDPSFVERFRREAQAAANLSHPNIVGIYDWGQEGGTYYIVMEYVEGRSLAEALRAEGPVPPDRSAEIAGDVAAALGFAHRNGVVHRDIKPGNVLISPSGQVKVADFGIATAIAEGAQANLTQPGTVMGTATYFSPEQAQGRPVDPRSDLYSLGVVLYEMLAGRPPFTGDSPVAIANQHVHEPPPSLSSMGVRVPESLEAINMKLLAKDPAKRYPAAEDLRADLRRYRDGHHVLAGKGGAAGAGAAAGAAVAGAAVAAGRPPSTTPPTTAMPPSRAPEPVAYEDVEPPRRTWWFAAAFVGLVVVLVGLILLLLNSLDSGSDDDGEPEIVTIPVADVVGLPQDEAIAELEALGFEVQISTEASEEFEEGVVISQNPPATEEAEEGSIVTLLVSAGVDTVEVPSVATLPLADAQLVLEAEGFVVEVREVEDDTVPEGEVISTEPEGGSDAALGSTIIVNVSTGPGTVAVPDVTNQTAVEATQTLAAAELQVLEAQESSESVAEGLVIRTDPPFGTEVEPETQVTIFVSTGPPTVAVPNVTDTTADRARADLAAVGLNVAEQNCEDAGRVGLVVNQDPGPGVEVELGTTVTICIGVAPPPTPTPTEEPTPTPTEEPTPDPDEDDDD